MKKFFVHNWLILAVASISVAMAVNTIVTIRNSHVIKKNNELRLQVELVKLRSAEIISNIVHNTDLGVRGFALTKENKLLDPFVSAGKAKENLFAELERELKKQGYSDLTQLNNVKKAVDEYYQWSGEMVEMARQDNMAEFSKMLKEDRGYGLWVNFTKYQDPLLKFEEDLYNKAVAEYDDAIQLNLILTTSITFVSIPILALILFRIQKERSRREQLIKQVEANDKKFVFNPGIDVEHTDAEIISQTIQNTRKASNFIKSMANSNYNVEWEGLDESNVKLNNETLAGDLINMREQLIRVKKEDEKRNWMNEGLASFSELVRNNQHDSQVLADRCVSFLAKYLNGQQGSLFVLTGEESDQHLSLVSCYAFDKKKWIEKRVELGSGLVGQAFLEGETIQLKQIPKGYISITSGLGDATPSNLVIVPLKYDIHTVALIELASFNSFESHHIMFLEKAGEFLASAILSSQNTHKMKSLLEHARINEEQMRQREEEMRQNMEELQATQEELVRKEREMQKRLEEAKMMSSNF